MKALILLLLASCCACAQAVTYGVFHPEPRLNPQNYWSEKDQFLLNILYHGCQFKQLQQAKFLDEWEINFTEGQTTIWHRSHEQQEKLLQAWDNLLKEDFFNPKRHLLKPFTQEAGALYLKKGQAWHAWRLNSVALQLKQPQALLPLANKGYALNHQDKQCQLVLYQRFEDMQEDWLANELDRVFLETTDYFFDSKENKQLQVKPANVEYWPSSMLVYASFGGQVLQQEKLQQALQLMLPLPKATLFLEPAYDFVPPFLNATREPQVAELRQAKIAFQQASVAEEFRIAYPDLPGMAKLALELSRFLRASFPIQPKVFSYPITAKLDPEDYEMLIGFADLDHGGLTELWNEVDPKPSGSLLKWENLLRLKSKVKIPLWWKVYAYLSPK